MREEWDTAASISGSRACQCCREGSFLTCCKETMCQYNHVRYARFITVSAGHMEMGI